MMQHCSSTDTRRPFFRVPRWLQESWLWRTAGRTVPGRRRPTAAPPRPKDPLPGFEPLESRCTPLDIFGVGQSALLGSAAAAVVFPTPAQALMRGSFANGDEVGLDYTATRQPSPYAADSLEADHVNAF